MKNTTTLLFLLLLFPLFSFAQTDSLKVQKRPNYYMKKSWAITTGYQIYDYNFIEIGIARMNDSFEGYHRSTLIYNLSNEFKLSDDFLWGLKAGVWIGGGNAGMNLGLNLVNYTDFKENSICLRPEIGIGFSNFRIVYGYNLAMTNNDFNKINTHNIGLNILFDFKVLEEIRE
ncbi:hypothetical protein [Aureivirga sp. CE67]|uniref:hypothetical protein n=1 Tax=Aureivirga sp. CE67 TaxID=1788983 RepID=UPI0018C9EC4A|nr:hypothetical protein [Aureivirga sp. CE67]